MAFQFDPSELDERFGWNEGPGGFGLGTVIDEIENGLSGIYSVGVAGGTKYGTITSGNILSEDDIVLGGLAAKLNGGTAVNLNAVSGYTIHSTGTDGVVHSANNYSSYDSVILFIVPVS